MLSKGESDTCFEKAEKSNVIIGDVVNLETSTVSEKNQNRKAYCN